MPLKPRNTKVSWCNNPQSHYMEEYMPGEWFETREEEEKEEEFLYSCRMIIVDIEFWECNIEMT